MIQIEQQPWAEMVAHAQQIYPSECVGVMLGGSRNGSQQEHAEEDHESLGHGCFIPPHKFGSSCVGIGLHHFH